MLAPLPPQRESWGSARAPRSETVSLEIGNGQEVTVIPYPLMYRLGFAPWERRNVAELWRPLFEGPLAMEPGRALDIGCGSGRDAVHLAARGWEVTAVEFVDKALARGRQRAVEEGVEVDLVEGDVGG